MPRRKDLTEQTFDYLTVLEDDPRKWSISPTARRVKCRCVCGVVKLVRYGPLSAGRIKSCGCRQHVPRHGKSGTRLYGSYIYLRKRGRVCRRWRKFEVFLRESKLRDEDRVYQIDVRRPLSPTNFTDDLAERTFVKWGRMIRVNGQAKNISGWARVLGVSRERARQLAAKGRLVERVKEAIGD